MLSGLSNFVIHWKMILYTENGDVIKLTRYKANMK